MVPLLLRNITEDTVTKEVKMSTLKCIGFTCERMDIDTKTTDNLFITIVYGIRADRLDTISLTATKA